MKTHTKTILTALLGLGVAAVPQVSNAATISVRVSQDTYIRNDVGLGSSNQNGDSDNELLVGINGSQPLQALLGFDVSQITDDVTNLGGGDYSNLTITSATLTIYERRGAVLTGGGNPSIGTVDVSSYDFGFVDSVSTYDDPDGDANALTGDTTPGGTLGTLLANNAVVSWDATDDTESTAISLLTGSLSTAIQNSSSIGDLSLILTPEGFGGGTSILSITSDQSGTTSRHALLDIEYTVVPEPGSLALLGLGGLLIGARGRRGA